MPIDIGIVRRLNIGLVLATSDLDKLAMIYGLDNAKVIIGNGLDLSSVDEIERIYACD